MARVSCSGLIGFENTLINAMDCNVAGRCATNKCGVTCLRARHLYHTESLHPPGRVPKVHVQETGGSDTVCDDVKSKEWCLVWRLFCSTASPSTCPPDCSNLHPRRPLFEFLERSHFQCNVQTPYNGTPRYRHLSVIATRPKIYKINFESAAHVWGLRDVSDFEGVGSSQLSAILPL